MQLDFNQSLVDYFSSLLDTPCAEGQKEQEMQDYMEEHSEPIPTSVLGLIHHGLQCNSVTSKLPLATTGIPHWVALSKRSHRWLYSIIELKQPKTKLGDVAGRESECRK